MNEQPQDHMEVNIKATRDKQGSWRNLVTNVKGPAVSVVLVTWLTAVVLLSIYGKTPFGPAGMGLLSTFIVIYLIALAHRS